jgi:superfamily I DNA and/or RNA helicase
MLPESLLQERLGSEARVGSADIFQGQEAPLVILSLCASSGREAPRGLGFLLNKNRINVALSRAKCLALVVGCPELWDTRASSISTMEILNTICRIRTTIEFRSTGSV